jgi:cytochrome c-type biogenesis protein
MEFEISNIGIAAAVAAGTVSFLSPCVLPLVPGYVSFIAGRSNAQVRNKAAVMLSSIAFVLGFSTVFVALGASATAVSRLLRAYSYEAGIVGGR